MVKCFDIVLIPNWLIDNDVAIDVECPYHLFYCDFFVVVIVKLYACRIIVFCVLSSLPDFFKLVFVKSAIVLSVERQAES